MGYIILGVTGGIAAYKAVDIARRLTVSGFTVRVVMTEHATRLVGPATFRAVTGNAVALSLFDDDGTPIRHISLAQEADVMIVAPATANIISKMANGLADDLLSTTLLATRAPLLVAPAMNSNMYDHPATRANIEALKKRGVCVLGPESGSLACGDEGEGRMMEPDEIVDAVMAVMGLSARMAGMKVLVTAGGTREPIDPVRFIGNRSSGKMGYALAEVAHLMGAQVILVSAPAHLPEPRGVELVKVDTAGEMRDEVISRAPSCSAVVMAAAVADFTTSRASEEKVKKEGREGLTLELRRTRDILKELGGSKTRGQVLVGFAAETGEFRERALAKLAEKNVDLMVANDVSREGAGFDAEFNQAIMLFRDGREVELDLMPKRDLARCVWDAVIELMETGT